MLLRIKKNMLIPYISIVMIVYGLFLQPINVFFEGYIAILFSESTLLTDYISIAGLGPTLFNSGSLMLLSYNLVKRLDMEITGSIFAGIMTIGGFAFFGKNILNVSLIFLGVFLYARLRNINLKSVIVVFLFATGISPISSVLFFGLSLPYYIGIPTGITLGILSGFLLVELSYHVVTFHKGYNLYNVGFACGILAFFYCSVFDILGLKDVTNFIYTNESHKFLLFGFVILCLLYIITGFILNDYSFNGLKELTSKSGRAVTDFTRKNNQPVTMINIGFNGLIAVTILLTLSIELNGPTIGGLFTILGFSAFGKHIKNTFPSMLGVILVVFLFNIELSIGIVLAMLFVTALAPIAGEHGILIGVLAGIIHVPVVLGLTQIHGGILLYANGFAAAFTAVIVDAIISSYKRSRLNYGTT